MNSSRLQTEAATFRLQKYQRLKKPAEYQHIYRSKQWGGSKHFTFNVLANDLDDKNKLGVTVSKKVSKRAVDRNHLKRVIREFYRVHQRELNGANLVITAKPSSNSANKEELQRSLKDLWTKVLKWQRWNSRTLLEKEEHQVKR